MCLSFTSDSSLNIYSFFLCLYVLMFLLPSAESEVYSKTNIPHLASLLHRPVFLFKEKSNCISTLFLTFWAAIPLRSVPRLILFSSLSHPQQASKGLSCQDLRHSLKVTVSQTFLLHLLAFCFLSIYSFYGGKSALWSAFNITLTSVHVTFIHFVISQQLVDSLA